MATVQTTAPQPSTASRERLTVKTILTDELSYLRNTTFDPTRPLDSEFDRAKLSALCLSGGGIRSAAFCIGMIEGLASARKLLNFDYLSTVSGGGFAGGWLQMLANQPSDPAQPRQPRGLAGVDAMLRERPGDCIRNLRDYTNYLQPDAGLMSADTWSNVVLYLRNLLINWLGLIPLLLLLPLSLVFHRTMMLELTTFHLGSIPLALGSLALLVAIFCAGRALPSHRPSIDEKPDYVRWRCIRDGVVWPTLAWALLLPGMLSTCLGQPAAWERALVPISYFATLLLGYGFAALASIKVFGPQARCFRRGRNPAQPGVDPNPYCDNALAWLIASAVATGLLYLFVESAQQIFFDAQGLPRAGDDDTFRSDYREWLTAFAPLILILVHLTQNILFIAMRHERRTAELDREWIARADGRVLCAALAWAALGFCCLTLPRFLEGEAGGRHWSLAPTWTAAVLSGPIAAWIGKQVATEVNIQVQKIWKTPLLFGVKALSVVFAVGTLALLGHLLQGWLGDVQLALAGCPDPDRVAAVLRFVGLEADLLGPRLPISNMGLLVGEKPALLPSDAFAELCERPRWYDHGPLVLQLAACGIFLGMVSRFGRINVNRFSMHGVYRNRLTRAFLGSARTRRRAEPFTDFANEDNPRFKDLLRRGGGIERKLFPVVNMTLNLTNVKRSAWAERKAAPFTGTPLACGSAAFVAKERRDRFPRDVVPPPDQAGAYVPTADFTGMRTKSDTLNCDSGPHFGGLLTISGAAVSPNWGYHSSPIVAFLMTMFNVRLGAWLPNPAYAKPDELRLNAPKNSLLALFRELIGSTTEDSQAIYLSDGGHFDNLGLYEMLRRRCTTILVVDAGQDAACAFFDLGGAIRKAEIDGLATVIMKTMSIRPRSALEQLTSGTAAFGHAIGTIIYPDGADPGTLVYVKPSYLPTIPAEIRAYGAGSPTFPHESTADQAFSESQFESYRSLGYFQCQQLVAAAGHLF